MADPAPSGVLSNDLTGSVSTHRVYCSDCRASRYYVLDGLSPNGDYRAHCLVQTPEGALPIHAHHIGVENPNEWAGHQFNAATNRLHRTA